MLFPKSVGRPTRHPFPSWIALFCSSFKANSRALSCTRLSTKTRKICILHYPSLLSVSLLSVQEFTIFPRFWKCVNSGLLYISPGAIDFAAGFISCAKPATSKVSHAQAYSAFEINSTQALVKRLMCGGGGRRGGGEESNSQ